MLISSEIGDSEQKEVEHYLERYDNHVYFTLAFTTSFSLRFLPIIICFF